MDLFGLIHIFDPITALLGDHDSHHAIHDGHHHDGHHHHGWLSGEHYHSHHLHHFDSDPISLLCADGNGLHSAPEPSAFVTVQPTIDPNHPDVLSAHYTNWSDNWVEILPVTHIDGDAAQDFHSTVGLLRLAPHETDTGVRLFPTCIFRMLHEWSTKRGTLQSVHQIGGGKV